MLYFLALPKQAGGQMVVNDRRAAIVSLPDDTDPGEALAAARTKVGAADPTNPAWATATGGFMSDSSLAELTDELMWVNAGSETPEELEGDPGQAALLDTQAIVNHEDVIEITGGSVELTVVDGVITGGTFTPDG